MRPISTPPSTNSLSSFNLSSSISFAACSKETISQSQESKKSLKYLELSSQFKTNFSGPIPHKARKNSAFPPPFSPKTSQNSPFFSSQFTFLIKVFFESETAQFFIEIKLFFIIFLVHF